MRVQVYCLCVGLIVALTGCSSLNPLKTFGLSESSDSYVRSGYDFSQVETVAIIDVVGDIEGEVAKNQIAEYFTAELLDRGYAPIERQRVQGILGQQNIRMDHTHPELYAVEAGQILDMPAVLLVSVPSFGNEISLTAKMIEVNSGTALWLGRASKSYKKNRSSRDDFGDQFDDEFSDSLYRYNMGLGKESPTRKMDPRMTTVLTFEDERRVSDLVQAICKSLPARASRKGLGSRLLGLIDNQPARTTQPTPPPTLRSREDLGQPETPAPSVEDVPVQNMPAAPGPETQPMVVQGARRRPALDPSVQQQPTTGEPYRAPVQQPTTGEPYRSPVQQPTTGDPYRSPVQMPTRTSDPELRVISPGTRAPIQTESSTLRFQQPRSIFEQGFEDAMAKQPTYITDQPTQRLTPPLEPIPQTTPQPRPQYPPSTMQPTPQYQTGTMQPMPQYPTGTAQPMPQYQTETIYRPEQPQMIWRQPVPREPEPMPEVVYGPDGTPMTRWRQPGVPAETKSKSKKSFWKKLLGLER